MKLGKNALLIALTILSLVFALSAQTPRSPDDNRNLVPTVGTGGPVGGPTGLFTIYDGQTLRRGEFTFSAAYSNFDRDPGNADITEVPISFQIGLNDHLELFFNTDAYRGIRVNSPTHLSSFYLPNSQLNIAPGVLQSGGAVILAPGTGGVLFNRAIYRPAGTQPFGQYPFTGLSNGSFGDPGFVGPAFGFPAATNPTMGPPRAGGAANNFPGVGSIYSSILPGIVFSTVTVQCGLASVNQCSVPAIYTLAPSYLPDAPFINRLYGQSAFSTFSAGAKWRWTGPNNPVGFGMLGFYRWYADKADGLGGFNQLQRGASPGGSSGDIGLFLFADARLKRWMNVSANAGYIYNSNPKDSAGNVLLDRAAELQYGTGVDFPVSKYLQLMGEFRGTRYVGGRTPNVFENHPLDALVGVRIFPARWWGFGAAYRRHLNQQDEDYIEGLAATQQVIGCRSTAQPTGGLTNTIFIPTVCDRIILGSRDLATVFRPSDDPNGFIFQVWAGRRNPRGAEPEINKPANVDSVNLDSEVVRLPCASGKPKNPGCGDTTVAVSTKATDPEGDVLTYSYTVSGGRVVGQGANVNWDLSGVRPGTYTITSAVDDGCGFCGQTKTKTITVEQCECITCVCPSSVTVTGPGAVVQPGDMMTFTANVNGDSPQNLTYNWTVSNGTIVEGQGTAAIRVATTKEMAGSNVTATVEIGSPDLCVDCPKTASDTGSVAPRPTPTLIDEIPNMPHDQIRAKLDQYFIALQNDPTATGTIINYGSAKEVAAREKFIKSHVAFRKFDGSRITYVNGGTTTPDGGKVFSKLWLVPQGADQPTP